MMLTWCCVGGDSCELSESSRSPGPALDRMLGSPFIGAVLRAGVQSVIVGGASLLLVCRKASVVMAVFKNYNRLHVMFIMSSVCFKSGLEAVFYL